ncbi:hypothetical protein HMPREF1861_01877 [Corynebacterium kroppenstedtii]|nr:hypothetical protein HMPREF1861_01877 [Corynebacterium kroppenstedtii]
MRGFKYSHGFSKSGNYPRAKREVEKVSRGYPYTLVDIAPAELTFRRRDRLFAARPWSE